MISSTTRHHNKRATIWLAAICSATILFPVVANAKPSIADKLRTELVKERKKTERLTRVIEGKQRFTYEDTRIAIGLANIIFGWDTGEATTVFQCESNLWPYARNPQGIGSPPANATGAGQNLFHPDQPRSSTYHTTPIGKRFPKFHHATNPYINIFNSAYIWDRQDFKTPQWDRRGSFVEWRDICSARVGD